MVFSYYIFKLPYSLAFAALKALGLNKKTAVYLGDELDYYILKPVINHLPPLKFVCKNKTLKRKLKTLNIKASLLPCFAQNIIMCRLAAHKFPAAGQKKIGLRHGPYHFKAFSAKKNYLLFHSYLFTSTREVIKAQEVGITNGVALGYPRLDAAFNGQITASQLNSLKHKLNLDPQKATLLFTATWDGSGLSAVHKWYHRLKELQKHYNILVSLHPWTNPEFIKKITNTTGVHLIKGYNTLPYIMLADICLGDTSSMLAECCALDKPVITFKVNQAKRIVPEVIDLITDFSLRIDSFDQINEAVKQYQENPDLKKEERKKAREIFFCNLDGTAGFKAAQYIKKEFNI